MHVVSHDENLQLGQRNTRNRKLFSSNFFQLNDRKLKAYADDRRDSYCKLSFNFQLAIACQLT